jgi:hypothetical protein
LRPRSQNLRQGHHPGRLLAASISSIYSPAANLYDVNQPEHDDER